MAWKRAYACHVCGWKGSLEPSEPLMDAGCPNCGVLLYPRPWGETWGLTLLLVGLSVGGVVLFILLR